MIGLCLAVAGTIVASLPVERFTLDWTHSIEKVRWQEDWRIDPERRTLVLVESRMRGSGAGMEPPENAVLRDGVWHAPGNELELDRLRLALSEFTEDWQLCTERGCRPLRSYAERLDPARGQDRPDPAEGSSKPRAETIDLLPCRSG